MIDLAVYAAGISFAASLLLTPMVRYVATRLGIVDLPDTTRKLHDRTTPLGGGVAVLLGFWLAALSLALFWGVEIRQSSWDPLFVGSLACATMVICGIGLLDDAFKLRGRQKLLGQMLAAGILVAGGLNVEHVAIFGLRLELGIMAVPFTMFWLLGAVNALNLLDGMDGLATSVGIVLSIALTVMAILTGHVGDAILVAAIGGSLLGFLIYNLPPASIFLGDAGSMLIGLILGSLAIRSSLKGPATVALAAPTAIWAIPIMDVGMAILRRKLTGRSIYHADRGHLHHSLTRRGYTTLASVAVIGMLCGFTAFAAVISVYSEHESLAVVAVLVVVATLAVTRLFGHQEFLLLFRRTRQIGLSLVQFRQTQQKPSRELHARLLGTQEWEELWSMLTGFAEKFQLDVVQLNIHLPAVDEDYHATWQRNGSPDMALAWHTEIPFLVSGKAVGRLKITSSHIDGSSCLWIGELISALKPFELDLQSIVEECLDRMTSGRDLEDSVDDDGWDDVSRQPVGVDESL